LTPVRRFVNQIAYFIERLLSIDNGQRIFSDALLTGINVLNSLDLIILFIIGYCVIRGVFRGIIKEASSIVGVLAGLYAAYSYYDTLTKDLAAFSNLFSSTAVMNIFSFLFIFGFVFFTVSALGILIKIGLKIIFLSLVDRLFGGCFGFIRGIMISSIILLVLTTFLSAGSPVISKSVLSPFVSSIAEALSHFASASMRHEFNNKMDAAKKSWDNGGEPVSPPPVSKAVDKNVPKTATGTKTNVVSGKPANPTHAPSGTKPVPSDKKTEGKSGAKTVNNKPKSVKPNPQ
jgi:membrane protein required for colicin V production